MQKGWLHRPSRRVHPGAMPGEARVSMTWLGLAELLESCGQVRPGEVVEAIEFSDRGLRIRIRGEEK